MSSSRPSQQGRIKWGSGILYTLSLLLTLILSNLLWLTLPQHATRIIGYLVAELSEIDLFLDPRYENILRYAQANPDGSLEVPEFPVSLTLSCADVAAMSKSGLRAHILQEASETIYLHGWTAQGESEADSSCFLRWSISVSNLFGQQGHRLLQILLPLSALCSVLLAIAFAHSSRGVGKLIALEVGLCAASLLSLLALWGASFCARTALTSEGDAFVDSLLELTLTLLRILQRNCLTFLFLGSALVALAFVADALRRGSRRPG